MAIDQEGETTSPPSVALSIKVVYLAPEMRTTPPKPAATRS